MAPEQECVRRGRSRQVQTRRMQGATRQTGLLIFHCFLNLARLECEIHDFELSFRLFLLQPMLAIKAKYAFNNRATIHCTACLIDPRSLVSTFAALTLLRSTFSALLRYSDTVLSLSTQLRHSLQWNGRRVRAIMPVQCSPCRRSMGNR